MALYASLEDAQTKMKALRFDDRWTVRSWCHTVEYARIEGCNDYTTTDMVAVAMDAFGLTADAAAMCPDCRCRRVLKPCPPSHRSMKPLGLVFVCGCAADHGILQGTVWHGRNFTKLFPATCLYGAGYSLSTIVQEFDLHAQHAQEWVYALQDLMAADVLGGGVPMQTLVGGPNIKVKIDETYLNRPKRSALSILGRPRPAARWLWGAVSDDGLASGEVALLLLPTDLSKPRGMPALHEALLRCVAPGSIIIHDDWGAYRAMD